MLTIDGRHRPNNRKATLGRHVDGQLREVHPCRSRIHVRRAVIADRLRLRQIDHRPRDNDESSAVGYLERVRVRG